MRVHKRRVEDLPRSIYRQCCWLHFGRTQPMYRTLMEFRHRGTGRYSYKHCGASSPPAYVLWVESGGVVQGWALAFVAWKKQAKRAPGDWNWGAFGYFYVRCSARRTGVGSALAKATARTIKHNFGNKKMSTWGHDAQARGFFESCEQRGVGVYL